MPANLENSAVATGPEKVSFHSSAKERQCQRMLKLPHNCTHQWQPTPVLLPGKPHGWRFMTLYIKSIPKKKKCEKAKWLSEGALQIAVNRREVKGKGEKERYTHLNAQFQRIARRDKKAFLSEQCKEIEENSRMGKTRDLFKKIRDIKGAFHTKMGTIKDRNSIDLTEAEDIKKRWQEYTEELYKKDLHNQDNQDGVITDLEPDILECEVKWALGSITMNKLVEVMELS